MVKSTPQCEPDPNCDDVTLTLPAILEDEEEADVTAAVATLPDCAPGWTSPMSAVGGAAPSTALQIALAATGGALLLGGIGVMTARRRIRQGQGKEIANTSFNPLSLDGRGLG